MRSPAWRPRFLLREILIYSQRTMSLNNYAAFDPKQTLSGNAGTRALTKASTWTTENQVAGKLQQKAARSLSVLCMS